MAGTHKPCGMLCSICMSIAQETVICRKPQIRQTDIPALLDSWVKNTTSVKMLCPQRIFLLTFS